MSGDLFKSSVSHYSLSSLKPVLQSLFLYLLIGEFGVNTKCYKSNINLIFIHFHRKVIQAIRPLMEKAYFFQIKLKDIIESLNTDYVLSVILKIKRYNAMKPYFHLKSNWFGILKTHVFYIRRWHLSYANQSQKENNLAIMRMPF